VYFQELLNEIELVRYCERILVIGIGLYWRTLWRWLSDCRV